MAAFKIRLSCFIILVLTISQPLHSGEIELRDKLSGSLLGSIRSISIGERQYIPIEDFAKVLSIQTTKHPTTKKVDLFYKQSKITFAAHTPFVQMDNVKLQMAAEVLYPNGDFYVPLLDMIKGFEITGINTLTFDAAQQALFIVMHPPNLTKIETQTKEDTVKIIINTTKKFSDNDIASCNYLDVPFYLVDPSTQSLSLIHI